jgi:hypothetical protein
VLSVRGSGQNILRAAGLVEGGPSYLMPAFTAAFLGSTQLKGWRFNVLGTIVAVYVLAVGDKGLQLAGAPACCIQVHRSSAALSPRCPRTLTAAGAERISTQRLRDLV